MNPEITPAAATPFSTPWGVFDLTRFPEDPRERLRAWDAADEYLLRHLAGEADGADGATDLAGRRIVVLGDRWGALTTALAAHEPVQIVDSHLGRRATLANLARAAPPPTRPGCAPPGTPRRSGSTSCWCASPRAWRCWRTSCTGSPPPSTRAPW